MRILLGSLSLIASLLFSGALHATSLQDLFYGDELIVGDKLFSDWDLIDDFGSISPDFSLIEVTGDDWDPDNPGLVYTASSGALSVSDGDWIDFEFSFTVTVVGSDMLIDGNSLDLTDFSRSGAGSSIDVIEFVENTGGGSLGDKAVEANDDSFLLSDSISFPPESGLTVTTFVSINTRELGDVATLTSFAQHFSQVPAVPLPPTLLLLVPGLLAIRLRSSRSARGSR